MQQVNKRKTITFTLIKVANSYNVINFSSHKEAQYYRTGLL